MTSYYFSFFTIIGILTLILTHIVTKKYAPYLLNYIINEDLNWNPNSDRIKLTFVIAFFIAPFVFLKQLLDLNHENDFFNYTCLSLIILSMIFCIWMIKKVINTDFNLKSKKTNKIESIKPKVSNYTENNQVELVVSKDKYDDFLENISNFEFFDKTSNSFELTTFKINLNNSLKSKHAYMILIVFWFEEVLKSKSYIDKLDSSYYEKINNLYLKNINSTISKQNWGYFKKQYIIDLKINDLKESNFYKELLKFYKRKRSK
ncbi:hypothetical protein [Tenacibaculum sp. 47A_GOM-205m]|uniref:hypothetical protein n=1 Tax=Tenacibaculum sp. 47A_GOM-205m TaxID=1380384 RepID=UPI00048EE4E0|nr:hypothetical protein [Tenacibaculum sp. 47A_GOM-205m]